MGRDITLCHPELQKKAEKLISCCKGYGLLIGISECFRTVAEQDALYAKGRTAPGSIVTNAKGISYSSHHQWGTAFDIYRNDGKGAYNDSDGFFSKVGAIGVKIGLEWGGNWTSPVDKPHFSCHIGAVQLLCLKICMAHRKSLKRHGVMKKWKKYTTGL